MSGRIYTMEQKIEIVKKINERIKNGQHVREACEAEDVANANYYRWIRAANLTRVTPQIRILATTKKAGKLAIIFGDTNDVIDVLKRL